MVVAHESHQFGDGGTQKQVTTERSPAPFLPALRLLLLQSLNCSIIHLSPACASSGMVQKVSKVNCLCIDNSQQFFQCFWSAFLPTGKAGSILSRSVSGISVAPAFTCEETCPRAHEGLMGLPRTGHKHRGLPAIYHLSSPLCQSNPLNSSLPQTASILVILKRISYIR